MRGDIANWDDDNIWETEGNVELSWMNKKEICSTDGPSQGNIMLMPSKMNWYKSRDMCR